VNREASEPMAFSPAETIAKRFVEARLATVSLAEFPGPIPADLASAYACQDAAIALWPDDIAGWKIGRIPPNREMSLGSGRLAGPIFRRSIQRAKAGMPVRFPIFEGGFAAVEAEFVFEVARDAAPGKTEWSLAEAAAIVGTLHVGVETAGSPLATINVLGPTVVISDFGNNAGLILGPEIADWRSRPFGELVCETFLNGRSVGKGAATDLPGGPIEAVRFLLEHCARRGRPLRKGMLVSSGAATGIHDIVSGETARFDFGRDGEIVCTAVTARPASDTQPLKADRAQLR